jgi:hypothetical protein
MGLRPARTGMNMEGISGEQVPPRIRKALLFRNCRPLTQD